MKNIANLFLKGFIIGIGKIIPGVSGSLIALSLGLYEKGIESISNLFNNFKENIYFLINVGAGILLSIIVGSNIVSYFFNNHYMVTMFLFIGLISGSICNSKISFQKKDYFIIVVVFLLSLLIMNIGGKNNYQFNDTPIDYLYLVLIGFIDALTMIIPGISGTAIFMVMGCYNYILELFSNIFTILFSNPLILLALSIGLISGIFIVSSFMNYLLKQHKKLIYSIITGFSSSSVYFLFVRTFYVEFTILEFIWGIIFLWIGYGISTCFKT